MTTTTATTTTAPAVVSGYRNLVSRTSTVHAPHPLRPDYFLCGAGARGGAPVAKGTDSPVDCANCARHPVTRYRAVTDDKLITARTYTRNSRFLAALEAVLTEREHRRRVQVVRAGDPGDPVPSVPVVTPPRPLTDTERAEVDAVRRTIALLRDHDLTVADRWHQDLNDTLRQPAPLVGLRRIRALSGEELDDLRTCALVGQ